MYSYDRTAAVPIGALERGIKGFVRQLEGMGLEVEMDTFKSGRGMDPLIGDTSYVELEITAEFFDEDGDEDQAYTTVKFRAGGYADSERNGVFGGSDDLRTMKTKALAYILKDLAHQGWKKP